MKLNILGIYGINYFFKETINNIYDSVFTFCKKKDNYDTETIKDTLVYLNFCGLGDGIESLETFIKNINFDYKFYLSLSQTQEGKNTLYRIFYECGNHAHINIESLRPDFGTYEIIIGQNNGLKKLTDNLLKDDINIEININIPLIKKIDFLNNIRTKTNIQNNSLYAKYIYDIRYIMKTKVDGEKRLEDYSEHIKDSSEIEKRIENKTNCKLDSGEIDNLINYIKLLDSIIKIKGLKDMTGNSILMYQIYIDTYVDIKNTRYRLIDLYKCIGDIINKDISPIFIMIKNINDIKNPSQLQKIKKR